MSGNNKLFAPAADRNKAPILEILQKHVVRENDDIQLHCLEISSGTGQHVVHFAKYLPFVNFQPSEFDLSSLPSIHGYIEESGLTNIMTPLQIDITSPIDSWKLTRKNFDLLININMIHITPWECTTSLFEKAGILLSKNGFLITYGPYSVHGVISPESNINFDRSLKERDERWGLRDVDELEKIARSNGFILDCVEEMPSNNKTLIWRRT